MVIGIPRGLLYYRYHVLWDNFFRGLGCETLTSGESNKKTLDDGLKYSIDECCLSAKLYMGHVYSLLDRCDYILVPRIVSYGHKRDVCVKFNALYDIAANTFHNAKLLDYNIDVQAGDTERKGFIRMGKKIGANHIKSVFAYRKAKATAKRDHINKVTAQNDLLRENGLKILLVSHGYNIFDKLIGQPVVSNLEKLGAVPIFSELTDKKTCAALSSNLSETLYWQYSREQLGALHQLENQIHGVILVTAFPCGPDSLVNELVMRRFKDKPIMNLIIDEQQSEAGLQTRLESFVDIMTNQYAGSEINSH